MKTTLRRIAGLAALLALAAQAGAGEDERPWIVTPVVRPAVPARTARSGNPIDAFLAASHAATILHPLGLDHQKMEVTVFGRTMRLVEKDDTRGPIQAILA